MTALTFATALEQFNAEFAPVRIPPIADFAREIAWDLSQLELDRDEFDAHVDAMAKTEPAEFTQNLSEARLTHYTGLTDAMCERLGILSEYHFAQLGAHLYATNPEFRNEFAHFYKDGILAQMDDERAERGRLANRQEDGEWMP